MGVTWNLLGKSGTLETTGGHFESSLKAKDIRKHRGSLGMFLEAKVTNKHRGHLESFGKVRHLERFWITWNLLGKSGILGNTGGHLESCRKVRDTWKYCGSLGIFLESQVH